MFGNIKHRSVSDLYVSWNTHQAESASNSITHFIMAKYLIFFPKKICKIFEFWSGFWNGLLSEIAEITCKNTVYIGSDGDTIVDQVMILVLLLYKQAHKVCLLRDTEKLTMVKEILLTTRINTAFLNTALFNIFSSKNKRMHIDHKLSCPPQLGNTSIK